MVTSANLMKEAALLSSFAVVFGGLLFQSGSQALRDGSLQSWAMGWVDVTVAALVVVSTALMVVALGLSTWTVRSADRERNWAVGDSLQAKACHRGSTGPVLRSNPLFMSTAVRGIDEGSRSYRPRRGSK